MDNAVTIIVCLLAAIAVGYVIYRVASRSGSSTTTGGYTRPGKPNRDTDLR